MCVLIVNNLRDRKLFIEDIDNRIGGLEPSNKTGYRVKVHESKPGMVYKDSHTSTKQLAEIAAKAKPGLLTLYHQLFWDSTDDDLLHEIKEVYPGKVVSSHDLHIYQRGFLANPPPRSRRREDLRAPG